MLSLDLAPAFLKHEIHFDNICERILPHSKSSTIFLEYKDRTVKTAYSLFTLVIVCSPQIHTASLESTGT